MPGYALLRVAAHALILVVLTLATQVGGLAYLAGLATVGAVPAACTGHRWWRRATLAGVTLTAYGALTLFVIPPIALEFGRFRLPCSEATTPGLAASQLTCALNRGYVDQTLYDVVTALGEEMARRFPGSRVTALDASFPFFDELPMPPHYSHRRGKDIDLAFFYRLRATGKQVPHSSPSPIGYFHFEPPRPGERAPCSGRSSPRRWDFAWMQPESPAWTLDEERTAAMVSWLNAHPAVQRLFLEPHLVDRLGLEGVKLRFIGCRAARHDDHLHLRVR